MNLHLKFRLAVIAVEMTGSLPSQIYGERLAEDDRCIINIGKDIILEFDNNLDQAVDEFVKLVFAMRGGDLAIDPPRRFGPISIGGRVVIR